MSFPVRGPDGVRQRMAEIQAKLDSLRGPDKPKPTTDWFTPTSQTDFSTFLGSTKPLDPFGSSAQIAGGEPTPELRTLIQQAANSAGVDPKLFESLVAAESGFNSRAVSHAGAQGLAQLMPGTAKALGVTDPFDPQQNLFAGAKYLGQMLRQFGGDEKLALAAYNAGPGTVSRFGGIPPITETQAYVQRVLTMAGRNAEVRIR